MHVLVTGAAGYIGSHTCLELLQTGHTVLALDNLSNSSQESLRRVEQLAGRTLRFMAGDVRDRALLTRLLSEHDVDAVIHFAGLKSVNESVSQPLAYYDNNVNGTLQLVLAMQDCGVRQLVFSSSATVYGAATTMPLNEDAPTSATNPYGQTKLISETLLCDLAASDPAWRIALLRYFNPVGAHPSGRIGEDPRGIPNNLMPYVAQVAVGKRPQLQIFGSDYPTVDGTGVRDFIHVVDLALGHLAALDTLQDQAGLLTVNLGTGQGTSVLQLVQAFERVSGRAVPYQLGARRAGDVASCYADPQRAHTLLGWRASRDLETMCRDTWRWQSSNPDGYPADD